MHAWFILLLVLRCFTSQGARPVIRPGVGGLSPDGFPHSEISGSKVAKHLPEAYRSNATSFIAS